MLNRLVTMLAAAALALPAVTHAAMDLYGTAHISLDFMRNGDNDPAHRKSAFAVTSNQSHVGLRGRESLRDQIALVWQIEETVDLDNGGWGDGRDSFIGLESDMGTILAGRYATPYRRLTDRLDVFADTRADYNAVVGAVDGVSLFNQRARNILFYTTPEDKRVRFALAYIANQDRDDLPLTDNDADLNGFSMSLAFESGPLYAGVSYEKLGQLSGPAQKDAQARKGALGWDFGQGTKAALVWEKASNGTKIAGQEGTRNSWYLNLSHVSGNVTYKIAYGMLEELGTLPDSGAQMIALGFSYALSRRTDVYLLSAAALNEDNGNYGLQPDHDDPESVIAPVVGGENAVAISAGIIHRFDIGL